MIPMKILNSPLNLGRPHKMANIFVVAGHFWLHLENGTTNRKKAMCLFAWRLLFLPSFIYMNLYMRIAYYNNSGFTRE